MADDVEEFVKTHAFRKPILIGHSMSVILYIVSKFRWDLTQPRGAKVAMTVALRSPRLLGALIPVDNAPVDANLQSDFHQYIQGLREIDEAEVINQVQADEILQKYEKVSQSSPAEDLSWWGCLKVVGIRQFLLTNLVRSIDGKRLNLRIPVNTLASSLNKMGDFPFKDTYESRYDGPTLIIRGSKSHYVADDVLPVIGQFFPRFELRDIDSGHWVISEKPDAFRQGNK